MGLKENYEKIKQQLAENVKLVAVSKTKPIAAIKVLYDLGQRDFGENHVQEMVEKWEKLPKDIRWHMIGHVQSNKIKYMAEFVHLIHGIDKAKRLKEVQKQAANHGRVQDVLLQIHIADETTKFGMDKSEAREILSNSADYPNVRITGLMGMATFTDHMEQVRGEFSGLNALFEELKAEFDQIKILSMGMSSDFDIAVEEGSTLVRVGSAIFGERNYV